MTQIQPGFNTLLVSVELLVGERWPSVVAYPCGNRLSAKIPETLIRQRCAQPGPLRIVFLGNLIRRKALPTLLDSMSTLPTGDYRLDVIGDLSLDLPHVAEIWAQILKSGLRGHVELLGPLSDRQLAVRLAESQVLVVPSSFEGFGIAYLEGMTCGLPVIDTNQGGAAEIIIHGRDSFLIAPGHSAGLARHLAGLQADRSLLTALSLNALRRFQSHPTWQSTGRTILTFLQETLTKSIIR